MEKFKVTIEFESLKKLGGFRQEWVSAEGDGYTAGVDSGAGYGNPLMTFWFKKGDKKQYFTASIEQVIRQGIDALKG